MSGIDDISEDEQAYWELYAETNDLIKNQEAEIKTLKEVNKLQCRDLDDAQRSLEDKHADNVRLKALLRELVGSLHDDISMRGNGWQINRYQKAMKAVKEVLGDE